MIQIALGPVLQYIALDIHQVMIQAISASCLHSSLLAARISCHDVIQAASAPLLQVLGQADFVIEAINEDETSKKAAFLLLDRASRFSLPAFPDVLCEHP